MFGGCLSLFGGDRRKRPWRHDDMVFWGRLRWRSRHDQVGAFPGPFLCNEAEFGRHPLVPERDRPSRIAIDPLLDVAGDATSFGLDEIGLHPHHDIDQVGDGPLRGADTLDDDEVQAGRDDDRTARPCAAQAGGRYSTATPPCSGTNTPSRSSGAHWKSGSFQAMSSVWTTADEGPAACSRLARVDLPPAPRPSTATNRGRPVGAGPTADSTLRRSVTDTVDHGPATGSGHGTVLLIRGG